MNDGSNEAEAKVIVSSEEVTKPSLLPKSVGFAWGTTMLLLAPVCELLAFAALAIGATKSAVALHLAAAGLMGEGCSARSFRSDSRALATAWFWVAVFPGFGVLAGLLLVLYINRKGRIAPGQSREERRREAAHAALAERKKVQQVTPDIVPIAEALRNQDRNVRVSAIDALKGARPKRVVKLLARERDNDCYDVRFRAAESLGKIATSHLDGIAEAKRQLESAENPIAFHKQLAKLNFEYADLGIDTPVVNRQFFEDAITHAEAVLDAQFDGATAVLLATAHSRLGELELAQAQLKWVLDLEPKNTDALFALAEVQYRRKDFGALRRTCARLYASGKLKDPASLELLAFWSGDDTTMEGACSVGASK
jgi:hypothetical protein